MANISEVRRSLERYSVWMDQRHHMGCKCVKCPSTQLLSITSRPAVVWSTHLVLTRFEALCENSGLHVLICSYSPAS